MCSILFFVFLAVLGALGGYIGVIGEATVITQRLMGAALWQGGAFCLIVTLPIYEYFPEHVMTATMLGLTAAILRWYIILPLWNLLFKIGHDFVYIALSKLNIFKK